MFAKESFFSKIAILKLAVSRTAKNKRFSEKISDVKTVVARANEEEGPPLQNSSMLCWVGTRFTTTLMRCT